MRGPPKTAMLRRRPLTRRDQRLLVGFEYVERCLKIIAITAIPVVLAITGYVVDSTIAQANRQREYIQMAVAVLSRPLPENEEECQGDRALRKWAVDVIKRNSEIPFPEAVIASLEDGTSYFPPGYFPSGYFHPSYWP